MIKRSFSTSPFLIVKAIVLCNFLYLFSFKLAAQPPNLKTQIYIDNYSQQAIRQMILYKIPACVTLAQAIYESSSGVSELAKRSNNHFGIKCHIGWEGDTVLKSDDELNECFRKYNSVEESFDDHSLFLTSRPRYSNLFKLGIKDYKGWCNGLKKAGYATFSKYATALIRIIEENKLYNLNTYQYLHQKIVIRESKEILPHNNLANSSISYSIKNKSIE